MKRIPTMLKSCGGIRTNKDDCKTQTVSRLTQAVPSGAAFFILSVRGRGRWCFRGWMNPEIKKGKHD